MNLDKCRICGSKEIYCLTETSLAKCQWIVVHIAYCEKCARNIEKYELKMINKMDNKVMK